MAGNSGIAIEAGLYTPPFGLLVYTVKSAIQASDPDMSVVTIFKSTTPYWIIMLIGMVLIINFPRSRPSCRNCCSRRVDTPRGVS